jgi:S-adenosylmethionine hydrolase
VHIITILTDFGLKDPYVGVMKGVILSINPEARIVDITHEIEPQDVREACFLVPEYYPYFPRGTVHLCVVDPTVGSRRRPLVVVADNHFFVGPDNGLFSLIGDGRAEAYTIENRDYMLPAISPTFHGRDVFAPVAAHLSCGLDPSLLGRRIEDPVRLTDLFPRKGGDDMVGSVVRFDRFGNAISNISAEDLRAFTGSTRYVIEIAGLSFTSLVGGYYEADFTCLIGSSGYLEFGYFKGSFAAKTGTKKGGEVVVRRCEAMGDEG